MPYPALPSARRIHYEIDGTVVGWNLNSGYGAGLANVLSGASMIALNGESPTVDSAVISGLNADIYMFFMFPQLVDVTLFLLRTQNGSPYIFSNIQSSVDSTTGIDGTWSNVGVSGTTASNGGTGDWWRSTTPATLTSNNTGIKGLRTQFRNDNTGNYFVKNVYFWGTKHSGQTPNDIVFLESDGSTEWPNDDDWGDVQAGSGFVTHTYFIKNSSPSLTANSITIKSAGSDTAQWTVSLDNVSFASSKSIASLGPGATQVFYVKYTPAAQSGSTLRPYAATIEADVVSWS